MDNWLIDKYGFVVTARIETKSIILTQRMFCVNCGLGRHYSVASHNSFNATGSISLSLVGGSRTVWTLENLNQMRLALQWNSHKSAVHHAQALGLWQKCKKIFAIWFALLLHRLHVLVTLKINTTYTILILNVLIKLLKKCRIVSKFVYVWWGTFSFDASTNTISATGLIGTGFNGMLASRFSNL